MNVRDKSGSDDANSDRVHSKELLSVCWLAAVRSFTFEAGIGGIQAFQGSVAHITETQA
ncbi:MAG: hypothetical protein AMXMBFR75_25770 [Candidatus Hinthialibacteria bacterium]